MRIRRKNNYLFISFTSFLCFIVFLYPLLLPLVRVGASEDEGTLNVNSVEETLENIENEDEVEKEEQSNESNEQDEYKNDAEIDKKEDDDDEDEEISSKSQTLDEESLTTSANLDSDENTQENEEGRILETSSEDEDFHENSEEPFWESCGLDEKELEFLESDRNEKCNKIEDDCMEMEECLKESIENDNESRVENEVESKVITGENKLDLNNGESEDQPEEENEEENGNDTGKELDTGEAFSGADVFNNTNTNIVGENFLESVENIHGYEERDINLLEKFESLIVSAKEASQKDGNVKILNIENENLAIIENDIDLSADSGSNLIETESGIDAQTGDAIADADIVNIANLNLIGKNWLFAVINVFGEWVGNLIVPGEGLLEVADSGYEVALVENENKATIENNIDLEANSGENEVKSENGTVEVSTGNSVTDNGVLNILNTNIIKDNWFFLMINNMGSWNGKLIGTEGDEDENSFSYDFAVAKDDQNLLDTILNVTNRNEAWVWNDITAKSNTGDNDIYAEEDANLETGNARSLASVINFINTNIVGDNWFFSIVNVLGTWKGNVEFAYPDIRVSLEDGVEKIEPGGKLHYKVTYTNIGKAECQDVKIMLVLPQGMGEKNWNMPGLSPGESGSVEFEASAPKSTSLKELESAAGVATSTKEIVTDNNYATDVTQLIISPHSDDESGGEEDNQGDYAENDNKEYDEYDDYERPKLKVNRKSDRKKVYAGEVINHTIRIKNDSNETAFSIVVKDSIKKDSQKVASYEWELGNMNPQEEILIEYQSLIGFVAKEGEYVNSSYALGYDAYNRKLESDKDKNVFSVIKGIFTYYTFPSTDASWEEIAYLNDQSGNQGKILGVGDFRYDPKNDVFRALLLIIFSWIVWKLLENREKYAFTPPLFAYLNKINWLFVPQKKPIQKKK